jgi:hypothetical protein
MVDKKFLLLYAPGGCVWACDMKELTVNYIERSRWNVRVARFCERVS